MGRVVGFCIFVAAFFLPAVREVTKPGASAADSYQGWFCASITLTNSFSCAVWLSKDFLAVLSGWINPLVLLYLVFLIWPKLVWPRRIAVGAVLAFMVATWIYFVLVPLVPLIGHVLWIVGVLMILAGEALAAKRHRPEKTIPHHRLLDRPAGMRHRSK